jgi:putative transcriptional regulator
MAGKTTATASPPSSGDSLKGKILIAMPDMADPRFEHGVIVMLEHGPEGAMGVMINKSLEAVKFSDLMQQLDIPMTIPLDDEEYPVYFGGPVEIGRGFVLHSRDVNLIHSLHLDPIGVTTSVDMLEKIASGIGPAQSIFCLGYTGWEAGQLDEEMLQNAWLHTTLDPDILFKIPAAERWNAAMKLAGVNPDFLSMDAGHA